MDKRIRHTRTPMAGMLLAILVAAWAGMESAWGEDVTHNTIGELTWDFAANPEWGGYNYDYLGFVQNEGPSYAIVTGVSYTNQTGKTQLTHLSIPTFMDWSPSRWGGTVQNPECHPPITVIRSGAFKNRSEIETLEFEIGTYVTNIGNGAFSNCTSMTTVSFEGPLAPYSHLHTNSCMSWSAVERIGSDCFHGCSSLTNIDIPDCVTDFGERVLAQCTGLRTATLGKSITRVPAGTFEGCTALESVTFRGDITEIGAHAFYGCTSLRNVVIPEGVTNIGEHAFAYGDGLTVVIPESVRGVAMTAFEGSRNLTVVAGNNVLGEGKWGEERWGKPYTGLNASLFNSCTGFSLVVSTNVTRVGESTFGGCSALISLTIPAGVTAIGDTAFSGCGALMSVVLPEGVESIGYRAFGECNALTNLVLPDSLREIGESAFSSCTALESVELPAGMAALGSYVFYGCTGLVSVSLPAGLETIAQTAFSGCMGLERIDVAEGNAAFSSRDGVLFSADGRQLVLYPAGRTAAVYAVPDGVEGIGSRAFNDCTHLVTVAVPASVGDMGFGGTLNAPFDGCSGLEAVEVAEGNAAYRSADGVLFGKPGGNSDVPLLLHPVAKAGRSYAIPAGTTRIGAGAFAGCTGLEEVDIPEGVTNIGYRAFSRSGLAAVSTPKSVVRIGDQAFASCTNLVAATIAAGQVGHGTLMSGDYEDYVFSFCTALEAVTLGTGVTDVAPYAFSQSGVRTLYVPSSWEGAAASPVGHVFYDETYRWAQEHPLEIVYYDPEPEWSYTVADGAATVTGVVPAKGELVIPATLDGYPVMGIGDNAFMGCTGLTSVVVPEGVTNIGSSAFSGCTGLVSVVIPEGVSRIRYGTFTSCRVLTNLVLPESLLAIDSYAFSDCSGLTELKLPGCVECIYESAFQGCTGLAILELPESLSYMDRWVFYGCTGLTCITMPSGRGAGFEYNTFGGCTALERFEVAEGNQRYSSRDGVLYSADGKRLVLYPAGRKAESYAVPEGVTEISWSAFGGCGGLTGLVLPDSLENLDGSGAFEGCGNLAGLEAPASWKEKHFDNYGESVFWTVYAGVPEGCMVTYRDAPAANETQTTPVPVAHSWLEERAADILAACGGDHEAAAKAPAANGRPVWECYVADVSATDAAENFKTVLVQENGQWVAKPSPDRGATRTYTVQGASELGGEEAWGPVTDDSRFFRVKVALPE